MRVKETEKWTNTVFLLSMVLVSTVFAAENCGDSYITIKIKGDCTSSSCIGECRDDGTCCLERCFAGDQPTNQEFEGCIIAPDIQGTCSNFVNQTECLATNVNKTFAVCWKHSIYFISSHPNVAGIKGFNPVNCPCEHGYTRKVGSCSFPQCIKSSFCELKEDPALNVDVCCLDSAIFPQENDCDSNQKLDTSVHQYLNVSTLAQCQAVCQGGSCKMTNASRLPACCKRIPKIEKGPGDDGVHGGVIAVIVVIIVVLVLVAVLGLLYTYRIKQEENQIKRNRNSGTTSIEITGVDEMIGGEQAWTEDGATYPDRNGNLAARVPDSYQVPDECDHVSTADFDLSVHSIERLQNGNAHAYDNRTFIDDDEKIGGELSYKSYSKRTGSVVSIELAYEGDNAHFDSGENCFDGQNHDY
ncbi:uncharacterized protein LOC123546067 isoform X2 [Mercenaria mercenaria]|nr:uncharacterized protein LOC123546067 isoform X2 [Mercenaria mercenaria]